MVNKENRLRKIVALIIYLVLIPIVNIVGYYLFKNKNYNLISIIVCLLMIIPFFIKFEFSRTSAREIVIVGVMVALSVVSRIIFSATPGFKPIASIIIISGVAFGGEIGFVVGALGALISNFFFGQGPWTPFQMFAWGFVGLISGLIRLKERKTNLIYIVIIGIISGIIYSALMDYYTTVSVDNEFNFSRYLMFIGNGLPFMITYAVSNSLFLILLYFPLTKKLGRIKLKYAVFNSH